MRDFVTEGRRDQEATLNRARSKAFAVRSQLSPRASPPGAVAQTSVTLLVGDERSIVKEWNYWKPAIERMQEYNEHSYAEFEKLVADLRKLS